MSITTSNTENGEIFQKTEDSFRYTSENFGETEQEDLVRIIKILLRMNPYFTIEDVINYRLLNYF